MLKLCGAGIHWWLALVVLVVLAGCGPAGPKTAPVSGKLTIKGAAPKGVTMSFVPVDPTMQEASASIKADGSYELVTGSEGKNGAMPGKYKVVLQQQGGAEAYSAGGGERRTGSGPPTAELSFPQAWSSAATTPKEVEVKAGDNKNVDITVE